MSNLAGTLCSLFCIVLVTGVAETAAAAGWAGAMARPVAYGPAEPGGDPASPAPRRDPIPAARCARDPERVSPLVRSRGDAEAGDRAGPVTQWSAGLLVPTLLPLAGPALAAPELEACAFELQPVLALEKSTGV